MLNENTVLASSLVLSESLEIVELPVLVDKHERGFKLMLTSLPSGFVYNFKYRVSQQKRPELRLLQMHSGKGEEINLLNN